jgi:hypothetical protein
MNETKIIILHFVFVLQFPNYETLSSEKMKGLNGLYVSFIEFCFILFQFLRGTMGRSRNPSSLVQKSSPSMKQMVWILLFGSLVIELPFFRNLLVGVDQRFHVI